MRITKSNYWFGKAIALMLPLTGHCSPFFGDQERGWFFYESKPVESIQVINPSTNPTKIQTPGEKAESELNQLKQELSQASALALLHPTPENVWNYQQLKTQIYSMSGVLVDQQMRNEWTRPDSYSANNATGGEGLEIDRKSLNHCTEDFIRKGSDTYGMYLFISSNCKYCNSQIKVLQEAGRNYGLSTMVISFDGYKPSNLGGLSFGLDNGVLSKQFGVKNDGKPVTVMLDTKTGQSQLLGYGYITIDNLNNRICRLYTKQIGDF